MNRAAYSRASVGAMPRPAPASRRPRAGDAPGLECLPAVPGEHAFEKIVAQRGIAQAPFLFHRQQWLDFQKGGGVDAAAGLRMPVAGVDLHALPAPARAPARAGVG